MDRDTKLRGFALMVTSRGIDERCKNLIAEGQPVPNYHSGTGQEAVSVGVGLAARPDDYVLFSYRDFGMLLAKGIGLDDLIADLLLRAGGTTKGHGGIMHVVSPQHGIVGRNGVFGSRFGIAIGLALASVRLSQRRAVVSAFGEAEGGRGPLYEALNIACLSKLPVVFVAENNGFSISSRTADIYAAGDMSGMFRAAPLPVSTVDGNDVEAVYHATASALQHCRAGLGPFFLEFMTYRIDPHIPVDDDSQYRGREEIDRWRQLDPIIRWSSRLLEQGVATEHELSAIRSEASANLDTAFERGLRSPEPDLASHYDYLYYSRSSSGGISGHHG